ncbi:hypothetical protein CBR_g22490 [Chara braunii]|uniref:Nascent polypeptide-associated complex subunit beta n=1 Tax=Chara braunii TaxID=69332 RepID=A0A388L2T2_CHABU|nr:hypothetical protein CBR_g22490 [Chara braunii]|eukprot:GBG76611.1 hypothetical protein CBR_g22490 [Chara braunii]
MTTPTPTSTPTPTPLTNTNNKNKNKNKNKNNNNNNSVMSLESVGVMSLVIVAMPWCPVSGHRGNVSVMCLLGSIVAMSRLCACLGPSVHVDSELGGPSNIAPRTLAAVKKKAIHKTTTTDDKRLQGTLKRLGLNTVPGIEEVNIFKNDSVVHFVNPKVQASIGANTYVISGASQTKKLQDLLPGIINQLGV